MLSLLHILSALLLWMLGVVVHRLWLSPLSQIPGPKLAAVTLLYEFYYEAVCSGKYTRHIEKLHRQYGPIIRISPYEVHIKDPDFCVQAFSHVEKLDKYGWWYRVFGGPGSTISTESHHLHKTRRKAFHRSLSQRAVRGFAPKIVDKLRQADAVLRKFADRQEEPVNLSQIYRCMAADVVSLYALPASLNLMQSPDLGAAFHSSLRCFFELATFWRYAEFLEPIFELAPRSLVERFSSRPTKSLLSLVNELESQVRRITSGTNTQATMKPCLLREIQDSDLAEVEKTPDRLLQEAEQFIVAGTETTGNTLTVTTFHILKNPHVERALREELKHAWLSFDENIDLAVIQSLPYLSAVVTEGLRVSHGVGSRLPRINRSKPVEYRGWQIPANTPISMTSRLHHEDPTLFPDPLSFHPERWLQANSKHLKKYLSPFGHGSRVCAGMHLAYAEIYMTLAYMFSRFEFIGCDATLDDIQPAHDLGAPFPRRDARGLRVWLRPIDPQVREAQVHNY